MKYDVILGEWDSFKDDGNLYDLIYLDPPFFTQRRHKINDGETEVYFDDIWENIEEYNSWLVGVFETCWSKLTKTGLIYSHNNFQINSLLFSNLKSDIQSNFITNISWQRSHPHNNIKNNWGNIVDSIVVYSKQKNKNYFNVQYDSLDEKYEKNSFNNKDDNGHYSLAPITGEKSRHGHFFEFNGFNPKYGWRNNIDEIKKLHDLNLIHYGKNKPYKKIYLEKSKGRPIQNIWTDISPLTRSEKNRREYPTQKPIKLLERIISSSCPKGGKILDPFGGSGTTLHASISTNIPSYVKIIDKNEDAIRIINDSIN
jgi:adenine-specific DNA-methyltransferase